MSECWNQILTVLLISNLGWLALVLIAIKHGIDKKKHNLNGHR